ncbi:MAG: hypothetical protein JNK42_03855 [Caedimonas sp.]|jgi:hypothetical protein|nr:hypothetical protein [Caedimonas sp.]
MRVFLRLNGLIAVLFSIEKRRLYEQAKPQFWRYAKGAEESQARWLKELLQKNDYTLLVAKSQEKIIGFIIGRVMPTPEVYNPGGLTLMMDDFYLAAPSMWKSTGRQLIFELKALA